MRLAITGTPGVGKTTLAELLSAAGMTVTDVRTLAAAHDCIVGFDGDDQAEVIDLERLGGLLPPGDLVIEGHMAHLLPVDRAWVIRLNPRALEIRLEARGYKKSKIRENLEAEAMDLVLQEALEHVPAVIQRDGTRRSPTELLSAFGGVPMGSLNSHDLETVDWSGWLLG